MWRLPLTGGQVAAGGDVRIFSVADFQWLQLVAGA